MNLSNAIKSQGYTPRSYSGRGMYGKQCLAFSTDDSAITAVAAIVGNIRDEGERLEVVEAFEGARSDSMGLGTVIYFPRIAFEEGPLTVESLLEDGFVKVNANLIETLDVEINMNAEYYAKFDDSGTCSALYELESGKLSEVFDDGY